MTPDQENQLVQVRLGLASGLYAALRRKHEPTARHCLRVALCCSAWSQRMNLPAEHRDELEVAALLHDVGKIGIADQVLANPGPLCPQEAGIIDGHWQIGQEILRNCASESLRNIIQHARAWFDGSKPGGMAQGEAIPLGARMLAIADAYDAMTTDHVYRPARSRERACDELHRFSGAQFDPKLVESFCEFQRFQADELQQGVRQRWLHDLDPDVVNGVFRRGEGAVDIAPADQQQSLFEQRLIEHMEDAVVFVDPALRMIRWNPAAERLTGISAESVCHRQWRPSLVGLRDERGEMIPDEQCPLAYAIKTGTPWIRRLGLRYREGRLIAVDAQAVPVYSADRTTWGLALLIHDVSQEANLERRCLSLHEMATHDPLTQLANRAEFDRLFDAFVSAHAARQRPCSLIMADLDHFKQVNDTYGHQAGDEVIRGFARLLKGFCRAGDVVARYGGEEFVMLCGDCDSATVARRAEQVRSVFSRTPHESLGNKTWTASLGVTEVQPGDTPDTMLRRADRALLAAKEQGRNRVVQLGTGNESGSFPLPRLHRQNTAGVPLFRQRIASELPLAVSVEKLRGFIADHHGHVVSVAGNHVTLAVELGIPHRPFRHHAEHVTTFVIDLDYHEEPAMLPEGPATLASRNQRTIINVAIRPDAPVQCRPKSLEQFARQMFVSLRAYLVAIDPAEPASRGMWDRARHWWASCWLQQ